MEDRTKKVLLELWGANNRVLIQLLRKRQLFQQQQIQLIAAAYSRRGNSSLLRQWLVPRIGEFYSNIVQKMTDRQFQAEFRVSKKTFTFLCEKVNGMERRDTNFRKCIPLDKRIAIALYKLSSSCEYRTVSNLFGVGKSTVCEILHEFCGQVVSLLMNDFICFPRTEEEVIACVTGFKEHWQFPQCVGSIDGTHIKILPPEDQASSYYCYKSFYSTIVLAVADYAYRFLFISVGAAGKNHDSSVFRSSSLYPVVKENATFHKLSDEMSGTRVPVCIIGDSAFPLMQCLQKPFPETIHLTDAQRHYNYCLSRARRVVENTFGRLKSRFRMLKVLEVNLENTTSIIQTCCVLNNICEILGDSYDPNWKTDSEDLNYSDNTTPSVAGENNASAKRIRDAVAEHLASQLI